MPFSGVPRRGRTEKNTGKVKEDERKSKRAEVVAGDGLVPGGRGLEGPGLEGDFHVRLAALARRETRRAVAATGLYLPGRGGPSTSLTPRVRQQHSIARTQDKESHTA